LADKHLFSDMAHDAACYLRGLYLVLQQGDPTCNVLDKIDVFEAKVSTLDYQPPVDLNERVPTTIGVHFPPIGTTFMEELGVPSLPAKGTTSGLVGVHTLFSIHTLVDCVWILRYIVDNQVLMAPSTLCLVLRRLCALHMLSPHENTNSTVAALCILLYSESFSPTFGPKDRVCTLIVISLYMITSREIDLLQVQTETLEPLDFDKFLLEGLIVVLSHDDNFGLELSPLQKLLLLVLQFWDRHKQGLFCEAYGRRSQKEQSNFLFTLLALHEIFHDHNHWKLIMGFLRLPLSANFVPSQASEIAIQYILYSDLTEPSGFSVLYAMSNYVEHCKHLVSSHAWATLVRALARISDEAFELVGHTLFTLTTYDHGHHVVSEWPWAGCLFCGLKAYLDNLEDMVNCHNAIQEWISSLIRLRPRYKPQIMESNVSTSLIRPATVGPGSRSTYPRKVDFLLMKLEKCLEV
jgi:hypothetical protein